MDKGRAELSSEVHITEVNNILCKAHPNVRQYNWRFFQPPPSTVLSIPIVQYLGLGAVVNDLYVCAQALSQGSLQLATSRVVQNTNKT